MKTIATLRWTTPLLLALALSACGGKRPENPEIARLQTELDALRSNADLASRAQDEIKVAERSLQRVREIESRDRDELENDYLYLAERRIQIAEAEARARLATDRTRELSVERERLVVESRTREAEAAKRLAEMAREEAERARALRDEANLEAAQARESADRARLEAEEQALMAQQASQQAMTALEAAEAQKAAADAARVEAEAAKREAELAMEELEAMRKKLAELEARPTPKGLMVTLGDVLFELNKADLKPGAARNLQPLVEVLTQDETRKVLIEGHTDSTGTRDFNMQLSDKRAASVRDFLVANGIAAERLTVKGLGPDVPLATNDTPEGRQTNRRVEVYIADVDTSGR